MVLQPIIDVFGDQEAQWRETLADDSATKREARQGGTDKEANSIQSERHYKMKNSIKNSKKVQN